MAAIAKTALVTGGNRGIGFEVCRMLAARGFRVFLGSRDIEKGEEAASRLAGGDGEVITVALDVANLDSIGQAIEQLPESVDVLINNAAILDRRHLAAQSPDQIDYIIRTNLTGPMILSRHFLPGMLKKKWGRIVNVTSGMGAISRGLGSDSVIYRVTKLALNGLTICLAQETEGKGVLVNSVDPGWVKTAMGGPMARKTPQQGAEGILAAALLPDDGPNGKFFSNGRIVDW